MYKKRKGGAYIMQPNGLKALYEVAPQLQQGLDVLGVDVPSSNGKLYAWWMIRDALYQEVLKQKDNNNVKFYRGWTFENFFDDPQSPTIKARFKREGCSATDEEDCLELEGALLIGADGIHSGIRAQLGLPPADPVGSCVWRGSIQIPEDHSTLGPLLHKGVHPMGYVSLGGATSAVSFLNFHSKYPGVMTWSISTKDTSASHPRQVVGPYLLSDDKKELSSILDALFELADPSDLDFKIPFLTSKPPDSDENGWGGQGRVTLVGDAAHGIRSAGGQAGGMAFEDACIFIRMLKQQQQQQQQQQPNPLADYQHAQAFIRQFENSRIPRVRKIWNDANARIERVYKGVKLTDEEAKTDQDVLDWIYKGV